MAQTLWDTTGGDIVKALLAERRAAGALASGLALSLVVVVDEQHVAEAESAATTAAAAHPCRLLIVVRRKIDGDNRLDAEVQVGGRLGANEAVIMRMYGRLTLHAESVVLPLLAPDAPVVTWWHELPPDKLAYDALGVLASRRVTDSARAADPSAALQQRAEDFAPGDTDLAWTRLTPWRIALASAFDGARYKAQSATVHGGSNEPSARLLAGWLASRLGWTPTGMERLRDGYRLRARRRGGEVELRTVASVEDVEALVDKLSFQIGKCSLGAEYVLGNLENLRKGIDRCLQALYRRVIGPIEDLLEEGDRLVVVPHGALHGLPFHAFHDGAGYLVDRYAITVAPSAAV